MPSDCYHAAESDGSVALHLSLGVMIDPGNARSLVEQAAGWVVADRLQQLAPAPFLTWEQGRGAAQLPSALARGASALGGDFGADVERALVERWLIFASAGGFVRVPAAMAESPLLDEHELCLASGPILFHTQGETLFVASLGQAVRVPAHASLVGLIERLNAGGKWRVGQLIADHVKRGADDPDLAGDRVRRLLQSLVATGGLCLT
jgi:hypothetical protein